MTNPPSVATPRTETGGRLASLDGMRGLAVLLVVVGHLLYTGPRPSGLVDRVFEPLTGMGDVGVALFFVLSGFLITSILVREKSRSGRISLRKFYIRRALRIWPAFYLFLGVVAVLAVVGLVDVTPGAFAGAGLFVSNYVHPADPAYGWWLGHTWSLSIEEQFYLVWPLVLLALKPTTALRFSAVGVFVVPLLRVLTYFTVGAAHIWQMTHTRADSLLVGCWLALVLHCRPDLWRRLTDLVLHRRLWVLALLVIVVSRCLFVVFEGKWLLSAGYSVENVALGVLVVAAVDARTGVSRTMGWSPLVWVGSISFSLYLWQQIFLAPDPIVSSSLLAVVAAFACATASRYLVEDPFLRLKGRFHTSSALDVGADGGVRAGRPTA